VSLDRHLGLGCLTGALTLGLFIGTAIGKEEEAKPEPSGKKLTASSAGAWTIRRDWDRNEVRRYGQWFTQLYEKKVNGTDRQRGAKVAQILQDKEMNLLLQGDFAKDGNDPRLFDGSALSIMNGANACGTFPILMHVYFCAIRGLPVSFTKVEGNGGDIRYSRGNHPVKRIDPMSFQSIGTFLRAVFFGSSNYTTGNWRTAPDLEGTDTVPVAVAPESTIPGLTVLYNSDGHGLAVARVSASGNVNILDAHPDGSVTSGQTLAALDSVVSSFSEKNRGSWYAGWRMIRLARCVTDAQGRIVGIRPSTNQEMRAFGYSDEQYTDMLAVRKQQPVNIAGSPTKISSFPDYVRKKLQTSEQLNPCAMIKEWAAQLKILFTERALFVDQAWDDVLRNGSITFPDTKNIYQAEGRWEKWSSPSSDCDRKSAYFMGVDQLADLVGDFDPDMRQLILDGFGTAVTNRQELLEAILREKKKVFDGTEIRYTTSRGKVVTLTLSQIEKRLFLMSFDPNHAPELRWGAPPDSEEAAGYRQIATPLSSGGSMSPAEAYRREQRLRYRLSRKSGHTSFDDEENPRTPLKPLFEERLARDRR